jgi:hypothetical protein
MIEIIAGCGTNCDGGWWLELAQYRVFMATLHNNDVERLGSKLNLSLSF